MPLNSTKSKNTEPQQFPENDILIWHQQLEQNCGIEDDVVDLFRNVLHSTSQRGQLVAIKTIGSLLTKSSNPNYVKTMLCVLVEVHSRCASRHPVQRAIASLLSAQSGESVQQTVTMHVAKTIQALLRPAMAINNTVDLRGVQYIEILLENFPPGEVALKAHLPLVLDFCVSIITLFCVENQENSNAMTVLIATMKTTTNIMLKSAPLLHGMFAMTEDILLDCVGVYNSLQWTKDFRDCQEKRSWTREKLSVLSSACNKLLLNSDCIPHDASVSAAMLMVATYNITLSLLPSITTEFAESPPTGYIRLVEILQECLSVYSPFAQLSLCHALLAKLPISVITALDMEERPLMVALFQVICQLFKNFSESSERYIASRTLSLWTCVARDYACSISVESPLYPFLLPTGPIMQTLLQYIWSLWEDPIDGIRHQCRDMFENVIKTYKHLQLSAGTDDFLFDLLKSLLSLESPTRGKFILLTTLTSHIPVDRILLASPQLPTELMTVMGHQSLACHAGDLWSRLVGLHWKKVIDNKEIESVWNETWVTPLVDVMCNGNHLTRLHITQYCLPPLFKCSDNCLGVIDSQLHIVSPNVTPSQKLTTRLACLRCAKTHCRKCISSAISLEELFASAMHHADEQVRLSALGLICESHRTTEPPELTHLPLLLTFVELNANSQSPGFRHPMLTSFKKLFIRIRDSSYSMLRAHQKSHLSKDPETEIAGFKEFLQALVDQQFTVLHPLSSFQRRNFSLSILQLLTTIFSTVNNDPHHKKQDSSTSVADIPPVFEIEAAVSREQARGLVDGLRDPFDANRQACLELLMKLDCEKIGLDDPDYVRKCMKTFLLLVCSPKSVNCTAAAFLLKLLMHFVCGELNVCLSKELDQDLPPNEDDPCLSTLLLLCQLLRQHITSAEQDLVKASVSTPMYGILQSIRTVIERIHLKPTSASRQVINDVIAICVHVSTVVSPVVCSSSPEGFLPDSHASDKAKNVFPHLTKDEETIAYTESQVLSKSGQNIGSGNSQSLLLSCWHSMKEIALLLGYIVGRLPVFSEGNDDDGIISHEQLEVIAGIFIHQLTEARHRGAFEMAYTGFCKLCHCLWSNHSPSLSKKPSQWIHDLLESLQSSSLARLLSITRRSAGLPFYVQAILTSEPSHTGLTCCKYTMQTLLKVAKDDLSSTPTQPLYSVEDSGSVQTQPAAVHALNILRSLYRESKLGDFVVPFIPEGIMIAIEGFSASLWPVRNSSTLLFSALVSRVFGAKRVQDEHSIENKMTSREFFTRFQSLYSFLLEQLKKSAEQLLGSEKELLQPSLFPTLLLLSRLYPSPLDEDNSTVTLRAFIPHLISCTCCPVWKTRVLVSRTLASMATECTVVPMLRELYDQMELNDQNKLHGSMLVINCLIQDRKKLLQGGVAELGGVSVACWLLQTHIDRSHLATSYNSCGLTRHIYLEILHGLLEIVLNNSAGLSSLNQLQKSNLEKLLSDATQTCFENHSSLKQPVELDKNMLFTSTVSLAHFRLLLLSSKYSVEFTSILKEVPTLNGLICKSVDRQSCLPVCTAGLDVLNAMTTTEYLSLDSESLTTVRSRVIEMVTNSTDSELLTKAHTLLADKVYLTHKDIGGKVFASAYQLCLLPSNKLDLRLSLIRFVCTTLLNLGMEQSAMYLAEWIAYLKEVCVPTQPCEMRVIVAEQLPKLWPLVVTSFSSEPLSVLCNLVMTLLQDSDLDVRIQMATAVVKIIPGDAIHEVECPNPASALRWFISSLPRLLVNLTSSFNILLSLLPSEVVLFQSTLSQGPPSAASNLLFDEDPINDYAEDIVVMQLVVKTLEEVVTKLPRPLSPSQLDSLVQALKSLDVCQTEGTSPWEDSTNFMSRTKVKLLAPFCERVRQHTSVSVDTGHSSFQAFSEALGTLKLD